MLGRGQVDDEDVSAVYFAVQVAVPHVFHPLLNDLDGGL